ncbi:MAG TPA: hypothetical protein PKM67_02170 [Kiritimatiellia bacterium]|nr:hypothetical protein [Kiritimatiellia bacterium]HNS80249.1 hypothetical protein [Kiritimatiellia bacterium]
MTGKQLLGVVLLGATGSLLGAILSLIGFGFGGWVLWLFGFLDKTDAVFKVKIGVIAFVFVGFVLGILRAIRMVH